MWSDAGVVDDANRTEIAAVITELRTTAVAVATEVAELVVKMRAGHVEQLGTKSSPTDVVTEADTAAESLARELLARLRPGEPVIGEEQGGDLGAPGEIVWVIDPIDGTVNFTHSNPQYCVSVGAERDGVPLAGAVVQPATMRCWDAGRGQGARLDGAAISVSDPPGLDHAVIGTGFSYRQDRRARQAAMVAAALPHIGDIRRAGSAALDLCAVASGWLDGYAEHGLHNWDWAAGALIAAEAGAIVRLPGPDDGLGDMVVAAGPGIVGALSDLLRACGAESI